MSWYTIIDLAVEHLPIPSDAFATVDGALTSAILDDDEKAFETRIREILSEPRVEEPKKFTSLELQRFINEGRTHVIAAVIVRGLVEDPEVFVNEPWYPKDLSNTAS